MPITIACYFSTGYSFYSAPARSGLPFNFGVSDSWIKPAMWLQAQHQPDWAPA